MEGQGPAWVLKPLAGPPPIRWPSMGGSSLGCSTLPLQGRLHLPQGLAFHPLSSERAVFSLPMWPLHALVLHPFQRESHALRPPAPTGPSAPKSPRPRPHHLTCPWCSPPCSCTHSRAAGRGSSASRCSRGAHLHTHPQEGRTGRPRRPQAAHRSALAQGRRAPPECVATPPPSLLGLCSTFP